MNFKNIFNRNKDKETDNVPQFDIPANMDSGTTVTVNGQTYRNILGDVSIINNKIFVNGKPLSDLNKLSEKNIIINIDGNIESLSVDCCQAVSITGDVDNVKTSSGDIDIKGNVKNGIQTASGDIQCGNVEGNISTKSGDITVTGSINGNCSTMSGDIVHG